MPGDGCAGARPAGGARSGVLKTLAELLGCAKAGLGVYNSKPDGLLNSLEEAETGFTGLSGCRVGSSRGLNASERPEAGRNASWEAELPRLQSLGLDSNKSLSFSSFPKTMAELLFVAVSSIRFWRALGWFTSISRR